jgi:hypothetical protein
MIRITGRLIVKRVKSRNGPFNVADLLTDVGEFKVKDPVLDQFKEGAYQGTFWIAEIYLLPYISFGRSITELRMRVERASDKPAASDTRLQVPSKFVVRAKRGEAAAGTADAGVVTDLFSDDITALLCLRKTVKLDPTIDDRARFRTQTARLRDLGYEFDPKTQTWHPKD